MKAARTRQGARAHHRRSPGGARRTVRGHGRCGAGLAWAGHMELPRGLQIPASLFPRAAHGRMRGHRVSKTWDLAGKGLEGPTRPDALPGLNANASLVPPGPLFTPQVPADPSPGETARLSG